jgi:hypothetical protein
MTTTRPTAAEDEYFRQQEADRRRDDAWDNLQANSRQDRAARERAKEAALRPCPACKLPLGKRTLRGVEVDACSSCHGVWLDAGELERLTQPTAGLLARLAAKWRGGLAQ